MLLRLTFTVLPKKARSENSVVSIGSRSCGGSDGGGFAEEGAEGEDGPEGFVGGGPVAGALGGDALGVDDAAGELFAPVGEGGVLVGPGLAVGGEGALNGEVVAVGDGGLGGDVGAVGEPGSGEGGDGEWRGEGKRLGGGGMGVWVAA